MKYAILKLNTTGLEPETNDITEISLLICDGKTATAEFHSYIKPTVPITEEAVKISGITEELVADKPSFDSVKEQVFDLIGSLPIVGHNVGFDVSFLNKYREYPLNNSLIDTLRMAQACLYNGEVGSYRFNTLCRYYNVEPTLSTPYKTMELFDNLLIELNKKQESLKEQQ